MRNNCIKYAEKKPTLSSPISLANCLSS